MRETGTETEREREREIVGCGIDQGSRDWKDSSIAAAATSPERLFRSAIVLRSQVPNSAFSREGRRRRGELSILSAKNGVRPSCGLLTESMLKNLTKFAQQKVSKTTTTTKQNATTTVNNKGKCDLLRIVIQRSSWTH